MAGQAPATNLDGHQQGRVRALHDAPLRRSYLAVLDGLDEFWEISYNPQAEPLYDGLVHDYRMGEALARSGFLGIRRIPVTPPLAALYLSADQHWLISVADTATGARARIISLDARREIGAVDLPARPAPGAALDISLSGRSWHATPVAATSAVREAALARYCRS